MRRRTIDKRPWRAGMVLACLAAAVLSAGDIAAQEVTSEQVADAVAKGVANLRGHVRPGSIPARGSHRTKGQPMLGVLAMLNAGVPADDPAVARLLNEVAASENQYTYTVALKCQVLAAADPKKYAAALKEAAMWLAAAQLDNGMWTYTGGDARRGRGDNSNTQYALLGLHEAAKAGVEIPKLVWERSRRHFENTQLLDGGWTYYFTGRGQAYGSMTAAGVSSLYICGQRLHVGGPKRFVNGKYPSCGRYSQNKPIAAGLAWLAGHFAVNTNPGGSRSWLYYYLYGLERVGMIAGVRSFGEHDWYRRGAEQLVTTQRGDGGWGQVYDTAFAILFLAKGNRPVLIQKLQWKHSKNPAEWNRNIHDLENLTAFIGDKLGKPVTWQSTTLALPLTELRVSPILFITGHEFPEFNAEEKAKLRRFVESGGTLLCEACCGSKEYHEGFVKFAAEVFGDYQLRALVASHPVFGSYYEMKQTYGLHGIDVGCRTGVFYSPNALSCLWEMRDYRDSRGKWSETALKLGTNVAAYATGKEHLPNRLDKVVLPEAVEHAGQPLEIPRGAVRLARLVHDGDYNADPHCLQNLCAMIRDKAKVSVVAHAKHLKATDEKIFQYPILFMTGHHPFKLSDEEIAALRTHLKRGGILVADSCCGRKQFDASFRAMVKQIFPDTPFKALPGDHPIYTGRIGLPLGELHYRKILADELASRGTTRPPLEAVTIDGRTAILYSKYDWTCALEGDNPYSCRGYIDEDGRKLALNIILYAIGY
ncbi:MAG TPA: DUF4159 domain-containing protein [Phycisphaerae bacterium]|nr:DUF4159 domain-containing protein [Phycisphaerae bacterium]